MKIREWSQRILWFVFGAVSVGFLVFISSSYGKRTETNLPVASAQDIQQRMTLLEQRVAGVEGWIKQREAAEAAAAEAARKQAAEDKKNRPSTICHGDNCP